MPPTLTVCQSVMPVREAGALSLRYKRIATRAARILCCNC